jgi:hypothetical protein
MVRRWRECRHCERRFWSREFIEDNEQGSQSTVNPLYTTEFHQDPPAANGRLKNPFVREAS